MVVAYEVFESAELFVVGEMFVTGTSDVAVCEPADRVICRCLQVTESKLCEAQAECPFTCLRDVAIATGAGSGCTACHRNLRKFLKPKGVENV